MTEEKIHIIAIHFMDDHIVGGQDAIDRFKNGEPYKQLLRREIFQMMARFDLGKHWGDWADNAPSIMRLTREQYDKLWKFWVNNSYRYAKDE